MTFSTQRSVFTFAFLFQFFTYAGAVKLTWDANSESDLVGYNVYRSETAGIGYVRINTSPIQTNSYTDSSAPSGRAYYYTVTAVNTSGGESGFSNEVSAVLTSGSVTSPSSTLVFPSSVDFGHPLFRETFVGVAVFNPNGSSNRITFSGRTGDGTENSNMQLSAPITSGGQTAYLTSELINLNSQTLSLSVRPDQGPVQGFFLIGDASLRRLDGVGELKESQTLYFPIVRHNNWETTLLYLFNPGSVNDPDVSLSLFDQNGNLLRRASRAIPALGSVRATIGEIFGADLVISEGFVHVRANVPLKGFELHAQENDFAALSAQLVAETRRLMAPHFFVADKNGNTEIRLLNVGDTRAYVKVRALDNNSQLFGASTLEIEPNGLLVRKITDILDLSSALQISGSITGHLDLELTGASNPKVVGAVSFTGNYGRFLSSLPMVTEGQTETLFLHVAQSNQAAIFTGCAILNPGTETATVRVQVFDQSGYKRAETSLSIEPGKRVVDLLNGPAFFGEGFSQVKGHIRVSSTKPVVSFVLFGDWRNEYLSAIEGQRPAN